MRFCNDGGHTSAKNTKIDGRNYECLIYFDNMLANTKLSLQKCLITKTMAVILHPTYLPYMAPCHFFLFPRRKSELGWQNLESWNSGKIANCPINNSEKSVWAVLPAVTEMLVPLHKLRRGLHWSLQQWPVIKVRSIYIVTDPGRLLSDTPLHIHSMTNNLCVTDAAFRMGYYK